MSSDIIIGNRYKIIKKIGEGGMAKVYLAYDMELEFEIALKVLKKENVNDRRVKNFKREAYALSMMDDDNIVKVYDVGEEGNIHYISTEYVAGMTLKEYVLNFSPIPCDEVVEITGQILHGLKHAHDKGVIHKDIKSLNILMDENRDVKITDFGIANIVDEEVTKTQSLMGTPQYVAPEILHKDFVNEQSDLYSVGILMYEMLLAKAPFSGAKPAVIMIKQMNHPIPSIVNSRADVPQSIENIVIKATAKKLENRYKNAEEFLQDLNTVFSKERYDEEKLILDNDTLEEDKAEKTVLMSKDISQEFKDKKKKKPVNKKIFITICITVVTCIFLFGIFLYLSRPVEMPNLEKSNQEAAVQKLKELGIEESHIIIKEEASKDIPKGDVIYTIPDTMGTINDTTEILLFVSSGPEKQIMVDYKDEDGEVKKSELQSEGYEVEIKQENSSVEYGKIIAQDPPAGTQLEPGQKITLNVSTGSYNIKMENWISLEEKDTETFIEENNLKVEKYYDCSSEYEKGKIYRQSPEVNKEIENGSTVKMYISKGACEATSPTQDKPKVEEN